MRSRTHVTLTAYSIEMNGGEKNSKKNSGERNASTSNNNEIKQTWRTNVTNKGPDWTKGSSYLLAVHEPNAKRHASALKSAN